MSWRRKEPGHQQPWYLLCCHAFEEGRSFYRIECCGIMWFVDVMWLLSQCIHYQESHIQQWFSNDSRELQSNEWKLLPNPLMSEPKKGYSQSWKIMYNYIFVFRTAQKWMSMSNCQVSMIVTIFKIVKSYVEANSANVEIINSYVREI